MGALVQTLPHHHRLRPAKEGSAPSSPVPGFFDRPAFRRISSLRSRSGPQSCSPLDQAHPLRGSRDFYTRAFLTAGHPTAKSGITTQLSGLLLRRNLHPLGSAVMGCNFAPRALPRLLATSGPSATLSSSADFPGAPVIRPTLLRRFRGGTRRASPVAAPRVLVTVPSLPPRRRGIAASARLRCSLLPSRGQDTLGLRSLAFSRLPLRSLMLRPGNSLTILPMASSMGSRGSVSLRPAIQATGRLALVPVGLSPTEHVCLWIAPCPSPKPCPDRSGPSGSAGGSREPSLRQGDRHPHTADRARSRRIRDG
jgi:hypothetical protein